MIEPRPPRTTMTTISKDFTKVNSLGFRYMMKWAKSAARDARERRADHEGHDLVARRVDAHRLGRDLVLADGEERAPDGRAHQPVRR